MEYDSVEDCLKNLRDLDEEYKALDVWKKKEEWFLDWSIVSIFIRIPFSFQVLNKEYVTKLEEVGELQEKCMKQLSHQRYRLGVISNSLKK